MLLAGVGEGPLCTPFPSGLFRRAPVDQSPPSAWMDITLAMSQRTVWLTDKVQSLALWLSIMFQGLMLSPLLNIQGNAGVKRESPRRTLEPRKHSLPILPSPSHAFKHQSTCRLETILSQPNRECIELLDDRLYPQDAAHNQLGTQLHNHHCGLGSYCVEVEGLLEFEVPEHKVRAALRSHG